MISRFSTASAVLLMTGAALAQTVPPDATLQARAHFQDGLTHAQQGDLSGALAEFEAAYAIRPHYSVLYNIGQARSTLGLPVEAAHAFEKYLADGGAQIPQARRAEVEGLLVSVRARTGELRVIVPAGSNPRVWLDGRELGVTDLSKPLVLAVGEHSVIASYAASRPEAHLISITHAAPTAVRLEPAPATKPELTQLLITCEVPNVDVDVPGLTRTTTPLAAPLQVPEGSFSVRFSRAGYAVVSKPVVAKRSELAKVDCDEHPLSPLPPTLRAQLGVTTTPADAEVFVDGQPFDHMPLPAGAHQLRVERDGFKPFSRPISLSAGKLTAFESVLIPTAATRERERHARSKQRTIGLVIGSAGLALLGTGVGVYTWNSGRYDDWRSKQASAGASNTTLATSVQRADDIALGLILAGTGAAIAGTWTFWDAQ